MRWSLLLLLAACAPEHQVDGRVYELKIPEGDDGQALPLLILAHGYGVNGIGQDFLFPFSKQVDPKRFLYVEAHGTQDRSGRRFWNATDACCNFESLPVDDVAFFRALVDDVKRQHAVKSVFVVGHSNGAFMALRLACDAPDLFDGIVSVSGSTWLDATRCGAGKAVPLLFVHGTADGTIPLRRARRPLPRRRREFDPLRQPRGLLQRSRSAGARRLPHLAARGRDPARALHRWPRRERGRTVDDGG